MPEQYCNILVCRSARYVERGLAQILEIQFVTEIK